MPALTSPLALFLRERLRCEIRDLVVPFFHNEALRLRRGEILRQTGRVAAGFVLLYLVVAVVWDGSYANLLQSNWHNIVRGVVALIAFWAMLDARFGARLRRKVPLLPFGLLMLSVGVLFALALADDATSSRMVMTHGLLMLAMCMLLSAMPLTLLEVCIFIAIPAGLDLAGLLPDVGAGASSGIISMRVLFLVMTMTAALSALLQLYRTIINIQQIAQDPLTSAYSRGFGSEMLFLGFETTRRSDRPFSVAFVDLDNFKQVNDEFGHDQGDRILARSGKGLISGLRRGDVVVRWGGEEFLVLLPGLTSAQAREVMRRVVGNGLTDLPDGGRQYCSVGIAERIEDGLEEPHSLVDLADQRMYDIKRDGGTDGVGYLLSGRREKGAAQNDGDGNGATIIIHPACETPLAAKPNVS